MTIVDSDCMSCRSLVDTDKQENEDLYSISQPIIKYMIDYAAYTDNVHLKNLPTIKYSNNPETEYGGRDQSGF